MEQRITLPLALRDNTKPEACGIDCYFNKLFVHVAPPHIDIYSCDSADDPSCSVQLVSGFGPKRVEAVAVGPLYPMTVQDLCHIANGSWLVSALVCKDKETRTWVRQLNNDARNLFKKLAVLASPQLSHVEDRNKTVSLLELLSSVRPSLTVISDPKTHIQVVRL